MKKWFTGFFLMSPLWLVAHCQLPCGIYHDNMVYEEIDQFVETTYKAMSVLSTSAFSTPKERNDCIRWVVEKDELCKNAADTIVFYFLQQKIKPDEPETAKQLASAHKLLFLLVQIKQNTDVAAVNQFHDEWDRFKLLFHREGYECEMEKREFKNLDELREKQRELKNAPPQEGDKEQKAEAVAR